MIPLLAAAWLQLASPHFELYTDAGEKAGRDALGRLELIREVFARDTPLPIRVLLFGSERDWREFRPSETTAGFYQSAPERDWIAMRAGEDAYRVVNHEYVHLVLSHASARLPAWLEEGTAEFYSTLSAKGTSVRLGLPVEKHVRLLMRSPWFTAEALSQLRPKHAGENTALFYAQSWALVHMLNVAPGYRKGMPRFAESIDQSVPPLLAFEQAFGRSFEAALKDLRKYVREARFGVAEVLARELTPDITVSPADPGIVLTELLVQLGRAEAAEKRLQGLPETPETWTARGLVALARKRNEAAKENFRKAIDSGSRSALPYFEYALLLRESGAPAEEVRRYLTEAAGRNPNLAEAQFLLGVSAQKEGRHQDAIGALEQAVKVLPRQSYFWHALAVSYLELKDTGKARRAALRAADNAGTQHEFDMARNALRLMGAPEPRPVARKRDVIVPQSWQRPQGDARVEGTLEHIDCLGGNARFQVRVNGKPLKFWVENPGEVLLNTPSAVTFEFLCGPQRPRRVGIEYRAHPGSEGAITAIDFLN